MRLQGIDAEIVLGDTPKQNAIKLLPTLRREKLNV